MHSMNIAQLIDLDLSALSIVAGGAEDFWNDPLLPSEWDAETGTFPPAQPPLPDTTVPDIYGRPGEDSPWPEYDNYENYGDFE